MSNLKEDEIEKLEDQRILREAEVSALITGWFEGWCQRTKRGGGVLVTTSIKEVLTDFYNDFFKAGYAATPATPSMQWVKASEGVPSDESKPVFLKGCRIDKGILAKEYSKEQQCWFISLYYNNGISEQKLSSWREGHEELNNIYWLDENPAPIPVKEDEIEVKDAIKILCDALSEDKTEGSYYYGWQANIAMAFYDECVRFCKENKKKALNKEAFAEVGNRAAKYFLDLLIRTPSYHHEKFSSTQPNNEETTPSSGSIGLLNLSDK